MSRKGPWCITPRRIIAMYKISALGWLLDITMNYQRILNQVTHSFECLKKSVQELLSKFLLDIRPIQVQLLQTEIRWGYVSSAQ